MNPPQDVKISRIARGLDNPTAPALPRGLHRREVYEMMAKSVHLLFEAWNADNLEAMGPALARLAFDCFDAAAVYGIDLGPHWKKEAESR